MIERGGKRKKGGRTEERRLSRSQKKKKKERKSPKRKDNKGSVWHSWEWVAHQRGEIWARLLTNAGQQALSLALSLALSISHPLFSSLPPSSLLLHSQQGVWVDFFFPFFLFFRCAEVGGAAGLLPGFQSAYVCVIAFNGHAKPCADCDQSEPQQSENVRNLK